MRKAKRTFNKWFGGKVFLVIVCEFQGFFVTCVMRHLLNKTQSLLMLPLSHNKEPSCLVFFQNNQNRGLCPFPKDLPVTFDFSERQVVIFFSTDDHH